VRVAAGPVARCRFDVYKEPDSDEIWAPVVAPHDVARSVVLAPWQASSLCLWAGAISVGPPDSRLGWADTNSAYPELVSEEWGMRYRGQW
jgi:hypothetical protein